MLFSIYDILAVIAIILSLILTCIEIRRRLCVLQLNIKGIHLIDAADDTLYLLLQLAIINPSTITKTIYNIEYQPTENYKISSIHGEARLEKALFEFNPLGSPEKGKYIRLDDVVALPLDVEPLHSRTNFLCIAYPQ